MFIHEKNKIKNNIKKMQPTKLTVHLHWWAGCRGIIVGVVKVLFLGAGVGHVRDQHGHAGTPPKMARRGARQTCGPQPLVMRCTPTDTTWLQANCRAASNGRITTDGCSYLRTGYFYPLKEPWFHWPNPQPSYNNPLSTRQWRMG